MDTVLKHIERHVKLTPAARSEFTALIRGLARHVNAGRELVQPDTRGRSLVLVDGWMTREVALPDGRRQITGLFLPGDIFDLNSDLMEECGYSLRAITDSTVAEVSRAQFENLAGKNPDLAQALSWEQLEQLAIQTEWLVNLGQRTARERIAHFLCEVFWRLRSVGRTKGDECDMALTQSLIADLTGLSAVHVNRILGELRKSGLIELKRHKLKVIDSEALADRGLFDPAYLKLISRGVNKRGAQA